MLSGRLGGLLGLFFFQSVFLLQPSLDRINLQEQPGDALRSTFLALKRCLNRIDLLEQLNDAFAEVHVVMSRLDRNLATSKPKAVSKPLLAVPSA